MCYPLIPCREEMMSRAEGPTQCQDPQKKGQKDEKGVQHMRQDALEQIKMRS